VSEALPRDFRADGFSGEAGWRDADTERGEAVGQYGESLWASVAGCELQLFKCGVRASSLARRKMRNLSCQAGENEICTCRKLLGANSSITVESRI